MKSINSRKGQTSITHLMNFSLPPRPYLYQQNNHTHHNRSNQRRNPTWGIGSGYHAIDKARYVQANYRFILRPDQNYQIQAVDSNAHLDWDTVMQILASAETQSASCPICLSIPVAPRMAKCGHIFCLPCLIRYMHSTDDAFPLPERRARWKKCPICEDSIYISETRPVRWFVGQEASLLREGGDVLLKLLVRDADSSLALPRDAMEKLKKSDDIPWYHFAEVMDHARFMKGGEDYMRAQYEEEIARIQELEREDELLFGEGALWTRKAVASIMEAKDKLEGLGNPPMAEAVQVQQSKHRAAENDVNTSSTSSSLKRVPNNWDESSLSAESDHEISSGFAAMKLDENDIRSIGSPMRNTVASYPGHRDHSFYFYNALPNFFLSPLDIRILKAAFGNFAAFPSSLLPRVEHISTGHTVDNDLRKRAKYMTHLPNGCEFSLLECDWTDIIQPSILNTFGGEIARRRKKNHEKEIREERERLRAEKEEDDMKWAAARRKRPSLADKDLSETDFTPLARQEEEGLEFSQTPPRNFSSFTALASPGTSPETQKTVWGTAAISSPSMEAFQQKDAMDDGWLQGWEQELADHGQSVNAVEGVPIVEGASRKKKGKKITLMATNTRRGA